MYWHDLPELGPCREQDHQAPMNDFTGSNPGDALLLKTKGVAQ